MTAKLNLQTANINIKDLTSRLPRPGEGHDQFVMLRHQLKAEKENSRVMKENWSKWKDGEVHSKKEMNTYQATVREQRRKDAKVSKDNDKEKYKEFEERAGKTYRLRREVLEQKEKAFIKKKNE